MPVRNEARTLRQIVSRVLSATQLVDLELVIVDDGSTDDSPQLIRELAGGDGRIKTHFNERGRGKGAAVRQAVSLASGDWMLIQDADLEYDPADYDKLLAPALAGQADAVFGSRFAASPCRRVLYFWHSLANRALTLIANVLNDMTISDMETCYKLVRSDIMRNLRLDSDSFAIEPELTTRLAQWGARIYEVPISYYGRTYAEGKHIRFRHAVGALAALFYYRFIDTRFAKRDDLNVLRSMGKGRRHNAMLMKSISRHLGRRVLEAGCGIGNLTACLLDRQRLVAADREPAYVQLTEQHYGHLDNVRTVIMDPSDAGAYDRLREERFDTVLCMNVLEHVQQPDEVLRSYFRVLVPGGHAVCLVPQYAGLFSHADIALGHLRRYSRAEMAGQLRQAGFEVVSLRAFNRLGALGWWINGRLLRRRTVSARQIGFFNVLSPLAWLLERLPFLPGLSLIAVGRKPPESA
jgi:glycosyltransferase involved in cell wall biosynthesis